MASPMPHTIPQRSHLLLACVFGLVFLAGMSAVRAQTSAVAEAEGYYQVMAYYQAIPWYERALEKDKDKGLQHAAETRLQLASCYRLTQSYDKAVRMYSSVLTGETFTDSVAAIHALHYAQTLQMLDRCEEAVTWFQAFRERVPQDARGSAGLEACQAVLSPSAEAGPARFAVQNLPFNSSENDYGAAPLADVLWFSSARPNSHKDQDAWTGQAYLDLYRVHNWLQDSTAQPVALPDPVNDEYHDGPGLPIQGGDALLYTHSYERKEGQGRDKRIVVDLGLFRALRLLDDSGEERWGQPVPERIPDWSGTAMHPALSADGQVLVFAASTEDGRGGYDLFVSRRAGDAWSAAEPLDAAINSPGDDIHPSLDAAGNLWFASDGRGGQGGLDIFCAVRKGLGWEQPIAAAQPINSAYDDFGIAWLQSDTLGVFASNRPGGAGGDDLYLATREMQRRIPAFVLAPDSLPFGGAEVLAVVGADTLQLETGFDGRFEVLAHTGERVDIWARSPGYQAQHLGFVFRSPEQLRRKPARLVLQPEASVKIVGQVVQGTTGEAVGGGFASILRANGDTLVVAPVDEEGFFSGDVPMGAEYDVRVDQAGYMSTPVSVATFDASPGETYTVLAETRKLGADMVVELNNIYYDYGKALIREDAEADLMRLRELLDQYPGMRIELSSHTDARSSSEFNQSLSQKRAESAKQWLSKRGIDAARIDAVGYGETRPRNRCTDNIECTEEEHQFNRRTEFKITYFDEVLTSKPRNFDPGSVVSPWEKAAARNAFAKDTEAAALETANALEDPASPWSNGTVYGIQMGIDRKPGSKRFNGFAWLGDIHVEASDRGFYRYVIGFVSTREEADQVRNVLRDAGISDAFVVTYQDGVRQR